MRGADIGISSLCAAAIFALLAGCAGGGGSSSVAPGPLRAPQEIQASPPLPTPPPNPTPKPQDIPLNHIVGEQYFPAEDTASGGQGSPVDGIACDFAKINYHVHTHLSLFYQGTQIAIPIAIGAMNPVYSQSQPITAINGSCFYHLHTHNWDGLIHNENQTTDSFTLGQFFDIWGEPLSSSNVAGFTGPVLIYVAQCATPRGEPFNCPAAQVYTGDPRAIVLTQHEEITIEVGGPYVWPPYYQWQI